MPTIYCRHIRPSGRRCQSFALRGKPFCYHHESVNAHLRTLHPPDDGTENILHPMNLSAEKFQREPILADYFSKTRAPLELRFPALEDADSIQLSLSMLLTALGQNRIDIKRASGMIYALQVATANVRNTTHDALHTVTEILTDDSGNLMSTDEDPEEVLETQRILEAIQQEEDEQDDSDDDYEEDEDEDDKAAHSRRMRYTVKLFQETQGGGLLYNSDAALSKAPNTIISAAAEKSAAASALPLIEGQTPMFSSWVDVSVGRGDDDLIEVNRCEEFAGRS